MKVIAEVFRSPKEDEMYLYVVKSEGLQRVPEQLLQHFGKPVSAMTLLLSEDRALARADIGKVLAALDEQGFYLQMPPAKEGYMKDMKDRIDLAVKQHNESGDA